MVDLLSAFNGAIPVGALRSRVLHDRINKLSPAKKKPPVVVKGGESIIVEKIVDPEPEQPKEESKVEESEKLDIPTSEVVKIETTTEEKNERKPTPSKQKRKYSRRKKSTAK